MSKSIYLSRKDSIVLTAIEIIDELGINELSIRELAHRQGVSEPALYRHFKSKQEIILAVLDYFSYFDDMIAKTISEKKYSAKDGIRFWVKSYAEYYENYPAMTAVLFVYDALKYDAALEKRFKDILEKRECTLTYLVEEGQRRLEIHKLFYSEDLTHTILGLTKSIIFKWRMNDYSFSLKDRILRAMESLLSVC
ncbi:MAG: TetR/AcrR family transcriptional regulator [Clostridia bacterium]|nr:TetR/AcrR family transcriptional regulator [Clostridia bacterium]